MVRTMDVRIYVHGRPAGQDVWSKNGSEKDEGYLRMFLDSRIGDDAHAVLVTDVCGNDSCYTYLRRMNIVEYSRRSEGYFAITVCIKNAFFTSTNLLYEVLDIAYRKLCAGSDKFIEEDGRFAVKAFNEKPEILDKIASFILQNLENNASLVNPLENVSGTAGTTLMEYALENADCPGFIADFKKSTLAVSPEYPSNQDLLSAMKLQMQTVRQEMGKAERELAKCRQDALQMKSSNESLQKEFSALKKKKEELVRKLADVAAQYEKPLKDKEDELAARQRSGIPVPGKLKEAEEKIERLEKERNALLQKIGIPPRPRPLLKTAAGKVMLGAIAALCLLCGLLLAVKSRPGTAVSDKEFITYERLFKDIGDFMEWKKVSAEAAAETPPVTTEKVMDNPPETTEKESARKPVIGINAKEPLIAGKTYILSTDCPENGTFSSDDGGIIDKNNKLIVKSEDSVSVTFTLTKTKNKIRRVFKCKK